MNIEVYLYHKCNECNNKLDIEDLQCGLCFNYEKEKYKSETIILLVKQFLKNNRQEINDDDYSHYDDKDFPDDEKDFKNNIEKEIYLRGFRNAREQVKIELIVDCLDYNVDLQDLFDDKVF